MHRLTRTELVHRVGERSKTTWRLTHEKENMSQIELRNKFTIARGSLCSRNHKDIVNRNIQELVEVQFKYYRI